MKKTNARFRIYIETSVVSYLTSRMSRDIVIAARQEITREVWPRLLQECEVVISLPVIDEATKGDREQACKRLEAVEGLSVLSVTPEAKSLADRLIKDRAIPAQCPEDALHVAVAAVNGCEFLLTWNFTHLNNASMRSRIRRIIEHEGLESPEICSPEEMFGDI